MGRHLTPPRHRTPPPGTLGTPGPRRPQRPLCGAGLLPTRRPPARAASGARPAPPAVRGSRCPRVTVHDLRHLAATITISAGVPLTVVSKTLRHSTLSTTANLYSPHTQQAAHQAVDTIDHVLSGAEQTVGRTDRPAWLRPPRDHIHRVREALHQLRSLAPHATSTLANQPRLGPATTLRPPRSRTHERPPSHG
ncbi:tyrosine-type recombinase/integrase [Streptomyces sp. ISL-36]|uniref:tyrosine-type recombinase/integrase n=1 Tax=Streptomyces sp. ISL-36 TaxID=2819182 RepID=UPI001BEBCFC4|nr:tyrosine-type recombinase/integrase [Streptomyces sp. ISL-36]